MSAGQTTNTSIESGAQDQLSIMMMNRIGSDDHDDGLVHGHQWAAAE